MGPKPTAYCCSTITVVLTAKGKKIILFLLPLTRVHPFPLNIRKASLAKADMKLCYAILLCTGQLLLKVCVGVKVHGCQLSTSQIMQDFLESLCTFCASCSTAKKGHQEGKGMNSDHCCGGTPGAGQYF